MLNKKLLCLGAIAITAALSAGCNRSPEAKEAEYLKSGRALLAKNDTGRALLEFMNAAKIMPKDAEPYYQLGLTYLALHNPGTALGALKKATELNPKRADAQLQMAKLMATTQSQNLLLLYFLVLYTLTYFIWTIGAIPYYSLGAELTDDYHERTQVIAVREGWGLAGLLAATILPAYLIHLYGGREGYAAMGAILGLGTAVFLFFSGLVVRERPEFQGRPSMNPYAGIVTTLKNQPFRILLIAFTFSGIAGAVPAVLVIYIAVYIIGTPAWWARSIPDWLPTWSYYLLLYFLCAVVSLPFWNRIASRFGKRATWGFAITLATVTSAACFWLNDGTVGYFSVILVLGGISFGNYQALPPSMVADLIDHDEVHTGGRREGSYFALWSFAIKAANAVTGFAALQVLEHVGYVPGVPQTATVKLWMLWMYSWFPAVFYLLSGLVLMRFRFTRADLDEAQRRIGRAS